MRLALGVSTIVIAAGGCLSFGDLSGGGAASADASDDALAASDGEAPIDGATQADGAPTPDAGFRPCPSTGGPTPVRVFNGAATYCIDSTEVSLRQYQQFLTAVADGGVKLAAQPPYCAFNTAYGPPNARADSETPVTGIDWCDAYAFCAWSGKRLCGQVGGGPISVTDYGTPAKSQWLGACTIKADGGTEQFPYGDTFEPKSCNGLEYNDGGSLTEVGSLATCQGSTPGLYDMIGNVDEWTDDCDGTTGATDCCEAWGGGYHDTGDGCGIGAAPPTSCSGRTRQETHSDVGFRCCSK